MPLNELAIVESTLREGEQFCGANFSSDNRVEIAETLDNFGVEYIEVTSPCASPQSYRDCERLTRLGLRSKVLTHIRCHLEDAKVALDTSVGGINMFIGTSDLLRHFGHGKSINEIVDLATEVINLSDFGLTRSFLIEHKLTGKQAIANRASQLGLDFDKFQTQAITQKIKALAYQ